MAMGILDDKVAIVTGSGRGIGRATATLLAGHGAKVVVSDLDGDEAHAAAESIDGETAVHVGDITTRDAADTLVSTAIDTWGGLDIVVNNAGYTMDGAIHKMSDDAFQRMLDIHVVAPFRVLRAAAPHFRDAARRDRDEGRVVNRKVVNVSSTSGTMGSAGQVNYSTAKAGVIGLTKALAKEWGRYSVNVNAVAFGFIETRLTAPTEEGHSIDLGGERVSLGVPGEWVGKITDLIPLGRAGTTADAAGGILLLCSPWSDYVQGQVLSVNGGLTGGMTS